MADQTLTIAAGATSNTISIATTQDTDEESKEIFTVTLSNPSSNAELGSSASAKGTIYDDDSSALTLSKTELEVSEGDSNGSTYTVRLATEPSQDVNLSISAGMDSDLLIDPNQITFNQLNWAQAITVTVKATEDGDTADDIETLTHSASGGNYDSVSDDLSVTVKDPDEPSIDISVSQLEVNEGSSNTYTVQLATKPTANVTLTLSGVSGTDLTVTPDDLDFEIDGWDNPQTVTVAAAVDSDGDVDAATLTYTGSGGDYAGVTASVDVTVNEPNTAAILLSVDRLHVRESNGTSGTTSYTVRLQTQPSEEVTVRAERDPLMPNDVRFRTVQNNITGSRSRRANLNFTTSNWNEPQTLHVRAEDDGDSNHETDFSINHTVFTGSYAAPAVDLPVVVEDDDASAGYVFSQSTLSLDEGESTSYTVRLDTRPTNNVSISIDGAGNNVTLNPSTLTFTPNNWIDEQTVNVTVANEVESTTTTLSHTGTGGGYGSVAAGTVEITVSHERAEISGITVTSSPLESGSDTYRRNEVITVAVAYDADVEVDTTGGDPTLDVKFASGGASEDKSFTYKELTGNRNLLFEYKVASGDTDANGIAIPRNALNLNGATIRDSVNQRSAFTSNARVSSLSRHKVNGDLELSAAQISSLKLLSGATEVALTPTFAGGTNDYTASVPTSIETLTIEVTAATGVTTTISPADASDGDVGHQIQLSGTETDVTVTASNSPRPDRVYTVTITRGTVQAEVSIERSAPTVAFYLDGVDFTITRSTVTIAALDVAIEFTQDEDFLASSALTKTVTIAANEATATLELDPGDFGGGTSTNGTLTATISSGTGYSASASKGSASVSMIAANPAITVGFDSSSYAFLEDAGTVNLSIVAETAAGVPQPTFPDTLSFVSNAIQDSTESPATSGEDFTASTTNTTFTASDFSTSGSRYAATADISVRLLNDSLIEVNETFEVSLAGFRLPSGIGLVSADGSACSNTCYVTVTIIDDESAPGQVTGVTLTPGNQSLAVNWSEVSGAGGYKVQWKSGSESFSDAATDSREATISSGSTTSHTITGLTNGTSYTVRVIATRSGVSDGDPSSEVLETVGLPSLTIEDASATEGSSVEFTVSLNRASANDVTVGYSDIETERRRRIPVIRTERTIPRLQTVRP